MIFDVFNYLHTSHWKTSVKPQPFSISGAVKLNDSRALVAEKTCVLIHTFLDDSKQILSQNLLIVDLWVMLKPMYSSGK